MHQRHGTPSRYVASSSRDRNTGAPELATLNDSLDSCDTALHLRQSQDGLYIRRRGSTCRTVSVSATTVTVATGMSRPFTTASDPDEAAVGDRPQPGAG